MISAGRANAAAINYFNAYPMPNTAGIQGGTIHNYNTAETAMQDFNDFDVRADFTFTQKDSASLARLQLWTGRNFPKSSEFPNLPAGFGTGTNTNHPRGGVSCLHTRL